MSNFKILFDTPWMLLLFIPAFALPLILHFRAAKKYRRTRNRIISLVLHLIIMTLSIFTLSGMHFDYDKANKNNEAIVLVDVSYSGTSSELEKKAFVKKVISESDGLFKIGVVTFGFDQVYAAEMSYDVDKVVKQYEKAKLPDTSATNIAGALNYARTLFKKPETAKIILVTDGIETDGSARSVVATLAADGVKVDTAYFPSEFDSSEVQLIGLETPDYTIKAGDQFQVKLTVQSNFEGEATVTLYDKNEASADVKGDAGEPVTVELKEGTQTVTLDHMFKLPGLHELHCEISCDDDDLAANNVYYTYVYLPVFEKILIVQGTEGEATKLEAMLEENDLFNVDVVDIFDAENLPSTVDQLRAYDQVVLMNVPYSAIEDVKENTSIDFERILYTYVHDIGGGLFTVGGTDENGISSYARGNMQGTLYESMLPVKTIETYNPPVGVVIIIDRSGSMSGDRIEKAKEGALSVLNTLNSWDYCGIVTLESSYSADAQLVKMTEKSKLEAAIDSIEIGGGTMFKGAIDLAGSMLNGCDEIDRRHILLVTDGYPGDNLDTEYGPMIDYYYKQCGITLSIVTIGDDGKMGDMEAAAALGGGRLHKITKGNYDEIPRIMREDLNVPEITDYIPETFTPEIDEYSSVVAGIEQDDMPELHGFYGSKYRADSEGVTVVLKTKYVPIYAQWSVGKGSVGSFMSDLNGEWSSDFMDSGTGKQIILNIINALFPMNDIREKEINATLTEDNYTTKVNIFTELKEKDKIDVTMTAPESLDGAQNQQKATASGSDRYNIVSFVAKETGVHTLLIQKTKEDGTVVSYETYKAFSYSEEYNRFIDTEACVVYLEELAKKGNGTALDVKKPWEVFANVQKTFHRRVDPKTAFVITALVLFLLDIAVRKFKFKWIHEIIRDRKAKKELGAK